MRFLSLCSVFSLFLILSGNLPAQDVRYIFPDIGAAGMNTYVEIVAAHNSVRPFGTDGLYLNGPTDALRVEPTGFLADKVVVGPLVVSWDGRLISTQIFVKPDVTATGTGQLRVTYPGSPTPATLDFEIVTPVPLTLSTGGAIGSGGAYRSRSKRGAMIVTNLSIFTGGTYSFSTADTDPGTAGNQGYLPFIIIAQNGVNLGPITLDASGNGRNGGPGGGGGGGQVCDQTFLGDGGPGTVGGNGFTGGGGGGRNGGNNAYQDDGVGTGTNQDGLNGVRGGINNEGCGNPQGTGGGTGHPFGMGGDGWCSGNPLGRYGGGSSAGENGGAGGGGYVSNGGAGSGANASDNFGRLHGNMQLVPLAGGSAGGGGNPQVITGGCGGSGGGGGGAVAIYSMGSITSQATIRSNGANGNDGSANSDGGGGSGGAVIIGGKDHTQNASNLGQLEVAKGNRGGSSSGNGSDGRVRYDGFTSGKEPRRASGTNPSTYEGPSIAPFDYTTQPTFSISGTRDPSRTIRVYMRSESGAWTQQPTPTYSGETWSLNLTATDGGGYYYVAAFQEVPSPNNGQYTAEPGWVTSQVAANIVEVDAVPEIEIVNGPLLSLGVLSCKGQSVEQIYLKFRNAGTADLNVRATLGGVNPGDFTIVAPPGITNPPSGLSFAPGSDTADIIIRFTPTAFGVRTAEVTLTTNDPRPGFNQIGPFTITGTLLQGETSLSRDTIDFGQICLGSSKVDSALVKFRGNQPFQISSISTLRSGSFFTRLRPTTQPVSFRMPMPGETIDDSIPVVFRFLPTTPGLFLDSVTIIDACDVEHVLYLKGEGIQVELQPSTGVVLFPRTVVSRTSAPQVIRFTNEGDAAVTLSNADILPAGTIFRIVNPPVINGVVLQPDEFIDIEVVFTPPDTLTYMATLQLNVEGPCNVVPPVQLRGIGVNICLDATPPVFDLVADSCSVDPAPVTQVVTLKNCGGVIIDILEGKSINGKVTTDLTPRQLTTQSESSRITTFTATWDPASGTGTDSIAVVWREKDAARQDTIWIAVTLKFDRAVVDLQRVNGDPVPDTLDIGGVYQCGPAQDTIVLVNAGTVEGDVTGRFETGGLFEVFPPPPYRLAVGEEKQLILTLDPSKAPDVGTTYRDVFILENSRCNRQWKVDLKSTRYQLKVDVANVNFGATNLGLPRTATVPLRNATLLAPPTEEMIVENIYIDPPSASPPFAIENAPTLPARLQAGGGSLSVDLSFTPDQEQVYTGKLCFQISKPCDTLICVDLRGEGIRSNIYVPQSNLDFGNVNYCEEDTLGLTIYSVGPVDLTVNNIRLVGGDIAGFEIISVSKPTPVTLVSGVPDIIDSIDVRIRFIPANVPPDGVKTTTLEIESDDPRQGLLQIPISGTRTSPQVVGPPLVGYGTVVVSGSSTQSVTLTNTSEDTIRITNPATLTSAFRLVTPAPLVIPPNSSIDVRVEFIPTGSQTYNDTLVGSFNLPCFGEMRVPLTGEGLQGETVISIPKTVAGEPGQEILIPIVLEEAQAIADVGATTLQIDLRFNGSMLLPLDVQFTNGTAKATAASGNIISDGLEGNDRVVRIELKNDPLPAAPDTLGWMKAVVLLGNSVATPITLENPVWTDGEVVTTTDDGEFTLQGYCNVGGDRLIRVEGLFGIKAVAPNPFGEETEIEFETVENGRTSLEIFDLHGRRVATLLDVSDLPVQAHVAVWNAEPYPAGVYYAVLTTPTQQSVKRMVVVK